MASRVRSAGIQQSAEGDLANGSTSTKGFKELGVTPVIA